ncbi:MAG: FeoB small GTPase domain-containing protein [Blautia faecis]
MFNQLTGAKQHVGNFPGVTVDRKDGVIKGHRQDTDYRSCREFTPCLHIAVRRL